MGRKKSKRKPPAKKQGAKLAKTFDCPFCNHESSCEVTMYIPMWCPPSVHPLLMFLTILMLRVLHASSLFVIKSFRWKKYNALLRITIYLILLLIQTENMTRMLASLSATYVTRTSKPLQIVSRQLYVVYSELSHTLGSIVLVVRVQIEFVVLYTCMARYLWQMWLFPWYWGKIQEWWVWKPIKHSLFVPQELCLRRQNLKYCQCEYQTHHDQIYWFESKIISEWMEVLIGETFVLEMPVSHGPLIPRALWHRFKQRNRCLHRLDRRMWRC